MSTVDAVQRILESKGTRLYALDVITSSAGDSNYPTKGPSTTSVPHSLLAFAGRYKSRQIDGEIVRATDVKFYVATGDLSVVPSTKDQVSHSDGRTWNIKDVSDLQEKDDVVLYILQLRK